MKDDNSKILFLSASGTNSEGTNRRIEIETGYLYWGNFPKSISSPVAGVFDGPGLLKDNSHYPEYEKRLSQEPFEGILITAIIDGKKKRLTINAPDELIKFNEMGEKESP